MTMPIWGQDEDDRLIDMVFDTNLTPREISLQMGMSELFIKTKIKELGLGWVRRHKGNLSRGQGSLTSMLRKLIPGEEIRTEEPLGNRLFLDIYCPSYRLGIEYHGRQHFEYVEHFHGDKEGFIESQKRDNRKVQICKDLQIVLVVFRYNDDLSEDAVYNRLLDAIQSAPVVEPPERKSIKGNASYEAAKQRNREYRKQAYRRMRAAR